MSNPVLPYRRKRLQQPQGMSSIDWSNPITRGLVYAIKPDGTPRSNGAVSPIRSAFLSSNGSDLIQITSAGVGFSSSGYNELSHSLSQVAVTASANLTQICVFTASNSSNSQFSLANLSSAGGATNGFFIGNGSSFCLKADTVPSAGAISSSALSVGKVYVGAYTSKVGRQELFLNGFSQGTTASATTHSQALNRFVSGANRNPIALFASFSRVLSDAEIKALSDNPWQIFAPLRRPLYVPATSGVLNAAADGAAQSGGSANIATQVALAAVGLSSASGSAVLSTAVPLSAVGFAVSGGTANAVATVTISAAGLAQAAGSAGLSAAVLLQGAGAAQAAGNAALAAQLNALASGAAQASGTANLSGGAPGELSASDGAVASGTAVLSVTVGLTASGSGVASGMASLSGGAAGQVAAVGGAQSGGSAVLRATVSLTAAGFVQAMGAGYLTLSLPFSGFAPLKMAAAHQRLNHLSISAVAASRLASNSRRLSQLRSEVSHG